MTNRTLTAFIVRLAGFALFIKIFDFFGSYFMSVYLSVNIAILGESTESVNSFDKLYISGAILSIANLVLSLLLIYKSDWIAEKMVKSDSEIKIDLRPRSVMRIVIATIGLVYCAKTLFNTSYTITNMIEIVSWDSDESFASKISDIIAYVVRAVIGVFFILKSERLANFALRRMKSS
jgi:hypothetical protein